jgi:hypothetical protein
MKQLKKKPAPPSPEEQRLFLANHRKLAKIYAQTPKEQLDQKLDEELKKLAR